MGDYAVLDCSQFLEALWRIPKWVPPEVIIVWGQNPAAGCPDGFYGHWVVDCMKRGTKLIVVDPRNDLVPSPGRSSSSSSGPAPMAPWPWAC